MTGFSSRSRLAAGLIAASAWVGFALYWLAEAVRLEGRWFEALWGNLGYLTDLSNLLTAVVMTGVAAGAQRLSNPSIVGWATAAIATVGTAFWLVGGRLVLGQSSLENILTHAVTPWAMLIFWLVAAPKRGLTLRTVALWQAWPAAYFAYALVRGAASGTYPYPFLDPRTSGLAAVLITVAAVTLIFSLWSAALFFLDRRIGSRQGEKRL